MSVCIVLRVSRMIKIQGNYLGMNVYVDIPT